MTGMRYPMLIFCMLTTFAVPGQNNRQGKPVIVGQKNVKTTQGNSVTIRLTDLEVRRSNGERYENYPAGFSLQIFNGPNYRVSGTTVTPDPGFRGVLDVAIRVNDGVRNSDRYKLKINVMARGGGNSDHDGTDDDHGDGDDDDDNEDDSGDDDDDEDDGEDGDGDGEENQNVAPTIIGQVTLTVEENSRLTIRLTDLFVNDPDNAYPQDFTLVVMPGDNYSVSGATITPEAGFTGTITVQVYVNDGKASSPLFDLLVTVTPKAQNVPPVITGQTGISTPRNRPVTIALGNLIVTDPDNKFPDDFTLTVMEGSNYTVSGNRITPATDFVGTLTVNVTVSDGNSTSNTFGLQVEVIDTGELQITGQEPLETAEDTALELKHSHLTVFDPDNNYPAGFSLNISEGSNYTVSGASVIPAADFTGTLEVSVAVTNGTRQSKPYKLIILVTPVNDPPLIEGLVSPLSYSVGAGMVRIAPQITVTDVDDENLNFAEIAFEPRDYQRSADVLTPEYTSTSVRSVFDPKNGALFLIGDAPVSEYARILRSVSYQYTPSDTINMMETKIVHMYVSDGESQSEMKSIEIRLGETSQLDIPTVFTPNGDSANDTWKIRGQAGHEMQGEVIIRVFTSRGHLVYEAYSLAEEWDGRSNGRLLPPGAYFFVIDITAPFNERSYKGVVTIAY
jgi:gliding motility-associated-like protein